MSNFAGMRAALLVALDMIRDRDNQLAGRDRVVDHQRAEIQTLRAEHKRQIERARQAYRELRAELRISKSTHVLHSPPGMTGDGPQHGAPA